MLILGTRCPWVNILWLGCAGCSNQGSVFFLFLVLWISESSVLTVTVSTQYSVTICFQLLQLLKVWGWSWRMLKGIARTLWSSLLRNSKAKKNIESTVASGRALESMQTQHFQSDYLKPHFYSISNLTATVSVAAAVSRVILFLNCCRLTAIVAVPQRRKTAHTFGQYLI